MGRRTLARVTTVVVVVVPVLVMGVLSVVLGGLAAGYRPVVVLSSSMGDAAPVGALVVAAPRDGDAVVVGDVVVMRRPATAWVTHRVVEIEGRPGNRLAITKGDANAVADPSPYPLDGEQLVARWVVPGLGRVLTAVVRPVVVVAAMVVASAVVAGWALRAIWAGRRTGLPAPDRSVERSAGRRLGATSLAAVAAAGAVPFVVSVTWALAVGAATVPANTFTTGECHDAQLTSVQSGTTSHAANGTITTPITAVDPAEAFVLASIRSTADEPADTTARVELGGGGTTVDVIRTTDAGAPPAVTVEWSVVEYGCGVTVQRGTINGDGTAQLDAAIAAVDPAASFVLVSSAADAAAVTFGPEHVHLAELADPTTLRIRTTGGTFPVGQSFSWQVVSFDDPADVEVQTVTANLGLGVASTTVALGSPADPRTTFLLASAASAGTGPDIGERLVRTHLVDASTVAVDRSVAGDPVEVAIQVVTLRDGSTVRHGTVDLAATVAARAVTVDPVDPARSTALSTVAQPGLPAGGMTDQTVDDVVGEASATFVVTDPTTVTVTRGSTASNASFGWQVVEWAGPGWWDGDYTFRQRIDVETSSVAAPDAYSVPVTVDHAALVSLGLSLAGGDDVRVLRWDGAAWTELDRVLADGSGWNQTTTTVWFETTEAIAADATDSYWLYYGNPGAGAPPADPEAVFLLEEGFESGTLGDFEDRTAGTAWYQALPWTRRIPVTVAGGTVATDLTDYPMLVSLTSADVAANATTDGSDLRFTAADGSTPLPHELESYDSGTGTVTAWVLVPTVAAASDTTVYLYYGAADAPDQQEVRATWPAEVEAAWHLARDPSGTAPHLDDATTANHDGLSGGSMSPADLVPGLVGRAIDFDGGDDVLRADPFDVAPATALTVSGWVRADTLAANGRIVTKAADASTRIVELSVTTGGALRGRLGLDGAEIEATGGTIGTGAWHHVAMTWDGTTQRLYVDGVQVASQPATGALDVDPSMAVTIGNTITGDRPIDGLIDEVRIETVARSGAWLAAMEANHRNPGTFHAVGPVETGTWLGQGSWSYRKPIVVDADLVAAAQTDYPLLVEVTDAELQAGALASGLDLVFTAADGTTRLDHVVESYDSGTGTMAAWVRVPAFSSTVDTELFLYYGNPSAADQQDPGAVFGPTADLVLTGGR